MTEKLVRGMRKMEEFFRILRVNIRTLIIFELIYKAFTGAVFTPLFYIGFNGIMHISGYTYLTAENISSFLLHPLTVVGVLCLLLYQVLFTFIDISAVIFLFDQASIGKQVGLMTTLRYALWNTGRLFHPQNWSMAGVTLLAIPYLKAAVVYGAMGAIRIPEMYQRYIDRYWYYQLAIAVGLVLIAFFLLRCLYAFFFFTLEQKRSVVATYKSKRRPIKTYLFDVLTLALIQVFFYLVYQLITKIGIALINLIEHMVSDYNAPTVMVLSGAMILLTVVLTLLSAVAIPISFAVLSMRYYRYMGGKERHHIPAKEVRLSRRHSKRIARGLLIAFLVSILLSTTYLVGFAKGEYSIRMEKIHAIAVTAHRGASDYYPENTMSAFAGAVEQGADWIELDVQQSKDGYIFVSHDSNLKRVTGVDVNVWEMDYEDIRALDAGAFFSSEYSGEYMPLLEEVIKYAKSEDVKLNIELKPTGHETNFEKCVVDIIRKEHFLNQCVVTSQKYQALKNVKAYDEDVKTIYVTSLAYGDVGHLDAADGYSVEAGSITTTLVNRVHNQGKEIYAWTVNTKFSANRLIRLGVDNIITDDVPMVQQCIYESKASNALTEYVRWLESYH